MRGVLDAYSASSRDILGVYYGCIRGASGMYYGSRTTTTTTMGHPDHDAAFVWVVRRKTAPDARAATLDTLPRDALHALVAHLV